MAKFGIRETNLSKLDSFIGPPLINSFRNFYGFDEAQARQALLYYREYFAEKGIFENAVYEGIPEVLEDLKNRGKQIVLATSKPTLYSERILDHFQLTKYFSKVVGSNLDGTRVKKGEVIAHIKKETNQAKGKFLMVGDREHDVLGAKENEIDVLAVGYGYGSMDELTKAGADYYVHTVKELRSFLKDMSAQ